MISDKIKELRNRSNMSQVKLSKALNVSRSTVNAWEMGISMPTIKYVIEMSKIFNTTADYILEINNENLLNLSDLSKKQIKAILDIIDCLKNKTE